MFVKAVLVIKNLSFELLEMFFLFLKYLHIHSLADEFDCSHVTIDLLVRYLTKLLTSVIPLIFP